MIKMHPHTVLASHIMASSLPCTLVWHEQIQQMLEAKRKNKKKTKEKYEEEEGRGDGEVVAKRLTAFQDTTIESEHCHNMNSLSVL